MSDDELTAALPTAQNSAALLSADSRLGGARKECEVPGKAAAWGSSEHRRSTTHDEVQTRSLYDESDQGPMKEGGMNKQMVTFADDVPTGRRLNLRDSRLDCSNSRDTPKSVVATSTDHGNLEESKDKQYKDSVASLHARPPQYSGFSKEGNSQNNLTSGGEKIAFLNTPFFVIENFCRAGKGD